MTKAPAAKAVRKKTSAPKPAERKPKTEAMGSSIPTPASTKPSFLSALFAGLDQGYEEALAHVQALEAELSIARRDLAAVEALKAIRDGGGLPLIGGSDASPKAARKAAGQVKGEGGRAPRGDVPKRVSELLAEYPSGLPVGTIIDRLNANDKEKTSIRNFLASGKRTGSLKYNEAGKTYAKA